jgi:Protein kinase domain
MSSSNSKKTTPPPLGPLPPVGGDPGASHPFSDVTDLDDSPTRPVRLMDLADLEASHEEAMDPTDELALDPTTVPVLDPDPNLEAPELPDPPVSFSPPEMTLPERLLVGNRRRAASGSDFESAVISKVADMSPAVMQMSPTTENEREEMGAPEREIITDVWAEGAADFPSAPSMPPLSSTPSASLDQSVVAGRYRVLERIGVGGMARIFRVQHLELGKHFALKIIHSALSEDTRIREMFYREARLVSSLDHPNIVLVTDFGVDDHYGAFIVMEYLKGETLHARLRREGRLHPNVACEVALQVAEAVRFIHGRDVVHCDIKSENTFLCEPPPEARRRVNVKLLDFGLSHPKIGSGRVSVSEVGGTPAYMAPERINRLSPRPSMDIYSFGVLFYEMLTGTLPFVGTVEEVLIAQLKHKPDPLSRRMKEPVDNRVEELVTKALQKDPNKRQKDMATFIYELRTVMDMLGIGRRRGGQPAERVPNSGAAARAKNCELLVADCPLPLFMTDPQANLVLANEAFASFVNLAVETVAGTRLMETRLGRVCPEILEDLHKAITTSTQTQRILSFPWRTAKQVSMMIWLKPEILDDKVVAILGIIHPFTMSNTA